MNRARIIVAVACVLPLFFLSCSGERRTKKLSAQEEAMMMDCAYCSYDDMISFIVEGYQMHWNFETRPEEYGLSSIYCYESPYAGFLKRDIDGNGVVDLIFGENGPEGPTVVYDIMTIDKGFNRATVLSGGERDRFYIKGNLIIEEGSNSASESIRRTYRFENGKLVEVADNGVDVTSCERLELDCFARYAVEDK